MADLSIYAATFNCGRELIKTDFFAAKLFNALRTNLPPDLVVLSLQEIAPLGYAFLGGSSLLPYFSRFGDAVRVAAEQKFGQDVGYETVVVRNVGLTGIMLFARQDIVERVLWMRTAGVGVGVQEMGHKGAVGVRIALDEGGGDVALTFVAAHLAPHEGQWQSRNQDWRSICEGLVFESDGDSANSTSTKAEEREGPEGSPLLSSTSADDGAHGTQHTLFNPPSHIFFPGDLNYRTSDAPPSPSSHRSWPQPADSPSDPHHYSHLLSHDQLTREQKADRTLHQLSEAEIAFPPTYKYSSAAQKHAAHAASLGKADADDEVWLWASHRVPSWCDRILYSSTTNPKIHAYDALPVQPTSDHRPVALSCSVSLTNPEDELRPPFTVTADWRERRVAARRKELAVGAAAYLGWTWEGEALLAGTVVGCVGGWLMLRALLGW